MFVIFQNLSPLFICGFQHRDGILSVILTSSLFPTTSTLLSQPQQVKCQDAEKSEELLRFGIGACVRLFNVKISSPMLQGTPPCLTLTATSGIRLVVLPNDLKHQEAQPRILVKSPTNSFPSSTKWNCLNCNFPNYPSKTVCFSCNLARREGPSGPLWIFKGLYGPPYTYETWNCTSCFARENSHWNEQCWKCGQNRKLKKKRKKQLIPVAK